MRVAFFVVFASLMSAGLLPGQVRAAAVDGGGGADVHTVAEQYLFESVNAERASAGLSALAWNRALGSAARFHADRMRAASTLSHQLGGEPDLTARAAASGARFSEVAENVAVGQSILRMHDALMRSPHHRENILDRRVTSIAIAVVASREGLWAVEDFAHDVEPMTFAEQERRVVGVLAGAGLTVEATTDARATCRLPEGYVGERPWFVMRYVTGDLRLMPEQLSARLATGRYHRAAVGACPLEDGSGFSSYNVAVLLYR